MKIGLVRHFKVAKPLPRGIYITPDILNQWFLDYDLADIEYGSTELGEIIWSQCYVSDMPRAIKTAEYIYTRNDIIQTDKLRELPAPKYKGKFGLPFIFWAVRIRLAPIFNRETRAAVADAKKRIGATLDAIHEQGNENVLIVSHAALMVYMRKELLKRGFTGPSFSTPNNGELYIFEK